MRAALSTIQQTLTTEAAEVLNHAVNDATRRHHSQITPLHVAAALLAAPAGRLREACVWSQPHTPHPFPCRALELCFSVALERLPAVAVDAPSPAPAMSNALMAALKRAQAHQRRGCPESQQQPLLAVKVELDQLVVSILDDPSVSRVMREAGFTSPAVKAVVEQSLRQSPSPSPLPLSLPSPPPIPSVVNPYLNPCLQSPAKGFIPSEPSPEVSRSEEAVKVIDVLLRPAKRNPVIVGDSDPAAVAKEVLGMIERNQVEELTLRNLQVVSLEKEFGAENDQILSKLRNLEYMIDARISNGGMIIDLGDLKWLALPEIGRSVVPEMRKLLAKYSSATSPAPAPVWLIGTARCETYLRCQVYYPSMEKDWDLQTISITGRGRSSLAVHGAVVNNRLTTTTTEAAAGTKFCASCAEICERELTKLVAVEGPAKKSALPQWLQAAKAGSEKEEEEKVKKKWREHCRLLHPSFHTAAVAPIVGLAPRPPSLLQSNLHMITPRPPSLLRPNLHIAPRNLLLASRPQLQQRPLLSPPLANPVTTELVLGGPTAKLPPKEKTEEEVKDLAAGIATDWERQRTLAKQAATIDADSFKSLSKGLAEKVAWQTDAASVVATALVHSKSGGLRRRRSDQGKSDTWLLFLGPDRVGKRKMAAALSDLLRRPPPVTIRIGAGRRHYFDQDNDDDESDIRKSTVIVRLAEAIRRNPFSIVVIEDVDQANFLLHRSLTQAIDTGWLVDSHGRQVSLGSTIFILTADGTPESAKSTFPLPSLRDQKVAALATTGVTSTFQLHLSPVRRLTKRSADWTPDDRPTKLAAGAGGCVSFDLNLAATEVEEESNSCESTTTETATVEPSPPPREVSEAVDETVVFRPVDFGPHRAAAAAAIAATFAALAGESRAIEVEEETLDRIVGGVWFGRTGLNDWVDRVLVPGFRQLCDDNGREWNIVKLKLALCGQVEAGGGKGAAGGGECWLPSRVMVDMGLV